jgi:hypothetical protein
LVLIGQLSVYAGSILAPRAGSGGEWQLVEQLYKGLSGVVSSLFAISREWPPYRIFQLSRYPYCPQLKRPAKVSSSEIEFWILIIFQAPQYAVNFTTEPEATPPNTQLPDRPSCDKGYVPRGFHRHLDDETGWKLARDEGKAPLDVYEDAGTFTDKRATVQIVTFYMEEEKQAKWDIPLRRPEDVRKALMKEQDAKTWRLIHCEGLHGPTMKTIAKETSMFLCCDDGQSIDDA